MNRPDPNLDTVGETCDRRVGAVLVDLVLLAVVNGAVWTPLAVFGDAGSATASALGTITTFAYFTALETHSGQTLGKKALGLVVVTEEGGAPDVAAVAVRNLLRFVDWLPAFYLLGAIVVAVTDRDQRLGDLAADTLVVRAADTEERVGGPDGDEMPDERGAEDGDGNVA